MASFWLGDKLSRWGEVSKILLRFFFDIINQVLIVVMYFVSIAITSGDTSEAAFFKCWIFCSVSTSSLFSVESEFPLVCYNKSNIFEQWGMQLIKVNDEYANFYKKITSITSCFFINHFTIIIFQISSLEKYPHPTT